ncbi:MAG: serine hydrolase [Lachnospiraceae bacterium]|nr:serine hydrolase [Lachnospiraceae bacterium]
MNKDRVKLKKGEYLDSRGNVRQHSEKYYARKRQIRRRLGMTALVFLSVVLLIVALATRGREKKPSEVEAAETVEASAPMPLVVAPEPVEEPEEEKPTGLSALSHPDMFYEGYQVFTDDHTKEIWNQEVISSYGILVDLADGHVVAQRNAFDRMYPASMTKVLTILVAAEHMEDPEDRFTMMQEITDYVFKNDCSQVGYSVGETMTVRELLYGTIMPSGGDAALGLAYYTAGSIEAFADMMNEKVAELGLSDQAHFTNPVGVFDEQNYCTPAAMAMIMKAALENDLCRAALGAKRFTTAPTEQHPEGILISNWFLRRIEDKDTHGEVLGAKTGFVNESRNCAVSYERSNDGHEYICVTGNAHSAWRAIYDHVAIYDDFVN